MKSTKKTFSVFIIIFGVLVTSSIHSEISYLAIKGLHASIRPEKGHLSPVHGFVWWKAGQVEKLYRYGVDSHKTIELIRKLFYLNPGDNITFDCTKIPTNVASFFTATTVGTIMRALETVGMEAKADYEKAKSDLRAALKNEFDKSLPEETKEKAKQYVDLQLLAQSKPLDSEVKELTHQQSLKKFKLGQLKNNKTTLESEKEINELTEEINKLTKEIQAKQSTLTQTKTTLELLASTIFKPDAVDTIVALIFDAYQESLPGNGQKYVPYTVHNILLGFLWRKATAKKEFLDYFAAIGADITTNPEIFNSETESRQSWLAQAYTQKELSNYEAFFASRQKKLTPFESQEFEQLIAYLHTYDIFSQPFPPQAAGGNPTYQSIRFPDCGETSLRNFFNNILYDPNTKTFNFAILEQAFGEANIHSKLKKFYKSPLSSVDQVNSTETLNKWAAVVSGLNVEGAAEPIAYLKSKVCEIDTGISNMLKVINRLIGVNSFNDLVKNLEKAGISMTFDDQSEKNFGEIHFTIQNRGKLIWHFQKGHFYITVETEASKSSAVQDTMNLISNLISDSTAVQQNNALLNLIMLYKDKKNLEQSLVTILQTTFSSPYILHAYLILYNLNNHEEKGAFIEKILENNILGTLPDNLSLDALIIKIIDALPHDDHYRLQIVSALTKKSNALKKSEKLLNQLTKSAQEITDDYEKIRTISNLLKAKELPKVKTLIENIAQKVNPASITGDLQKVLAISALLEAKELLNTTPKLVNFIENIALSITDDSYKAEAISKLLEAKELFADIPKLQKLIEAIAKSITNDYDKVRAISELLKAKELLTQIPELKALISDIAKKVNPTSITDDYDKVRAISELLKAKELFAQIPELKTLIYDIAQKVNPTSITDDYYKVLAISELLKAKELFIQIPKLKTLIENIAQKVNPTSIDDLDKVNAIFKLLKAKELFADIPKLPDLIENIALSINDHSRLKTILENITDNKEISAEQKERIIQKLNARLATPESPH